MGPERRGLKGADPRTGNLRRTTSTANEIDSNEIDSRRTTCSEA
jgi:hypothetical protein